MNDSRNLSLLPISDEIARQAVIDYNERLDSSIIPGSMKPNGKTIAAMRASITRALREAALAQRAQPCKHTYSESSAYCLGCGQLQQAQPLTDEDASRIALAVFDADGPDSRAIIHDIVLRYEAHTRRRDRMAQQAQPLTAFRTWWDGPGDHRDHGWMHAVQATWNARDLMAQQAQPEVPTLTENQRAALRFVRGFIGDHYIAFRDATKIDVVAEIDGLIFAKETTQQAQPRCGNTEPHQDHRLFDDGTVFGRFCEGVSAPQPDPEDAQCIRPFGDAFDCPVHDPRKHKKQ